MHVYTDTWAHQGFVGFNHEINDVSKINGGVDTLFMDKMASFFVGEAFPLGHGSLLSYPDRPFLEWDITAII
jgi:hypothetical protein